MEAEITASYQLVLGLLGVIEKSDAQLTASFSRHACSALLSKPLVMASGVTSNQQQKMLLANACNRLLDGTTSLVNKGSLADQALAVQVLAACLHACDVVSLLDRAAGWINLLTEALKRANAATQAASPAAAALSPAAAAAQLAQESCTAAATLFDRLHQHIELPGVRREVTSAVPKLLPQLLVLLQKLVLLQNTSASFSCYTSGLQLLAALLRCVPTALRSVATACEKTLQQLAVHVASSVSTSTPPAAAAEHQQVLAEAAQCIALLPAAPGDAATWSDTARRLLSSSHDVLDHLLMGLEGRPLDAQFRAYLAPATADGQQQQQQQGAAAASWLTSLPWQQEQQPGAGRRQMPPAKLLLGVCISALQNLLQQPFAAPAPVPAYSLVLLAARLLLFDAAAAVAAGAVAASSTMYQELLVLQPQLQQAGWRLLQVAVAASGQQLQLQGVLLRLVRQGLRSVQVLGYAALQQRPVPVRCCVYSTTADVLRATGLAGVRGLATEAVGCAVMELYGHTAAAKAVHTNPSSSKASGQRPAKRVRTSGAAGGDLEQFDPAASAAAAAAGSDVYRLPAGADLQAQAAALHMLQQLLESGGQLLPAEVRAHVDAVAFHMVQTAAAASLRLQQQPAVCPVTSSHNLGALQVAAYQTLLASILVPCSSRPPFLSQALLLFREGRHSSDPLVAAVCQAASVQCEALLHPRTTAISAVKQNSGMEAVQPLSKPLMWNAFDSVTQAAATAVRVADQMAPIAAAADTAVVAPAVSRQQQQQQQQDVPQQHVSMSPMHNGRVVIGYPVHTAGLQQHQAVPAQQPPLPLSKLARPTANEDTAVQDADAPGASPDLQPMLTRVEAAKKQQQLQQQVPGTTYHAAEGLELNPQAALNSASAVEAVVEGARGAAAVQPTAGAQTTGISDQAAVVAGQSGWQQGAAATVFHDESSDSEGPLPDIDSGSDSEDGESS